MIPKLLIKWLINSLAVFAAGYLTRGTHIADFWSGVIAAALLGIVNAFIRPVLVILTLPLSILTLGLFTLVINALMLKLVAWAVAGFAVEGFWAAFLGSACHKPCQLVHLHPVRCRVPFL